MEVILNRLGASITLAVVLVCPFPLFAQAAPATSPPVSSQGSDDTQVQPALQPETSTRISPQQAKDLFQSLNQILSFASAETTLPIRHPVKRRLISRGEVERYVLDRFRHDKDAKRMQREEIVLRKFGLLDRDFHLQPFLISLLTEQIAGFYDNKTKTVNLLDWVAPDDQKPVMAHELTHALQDQYTDLGKWESNSPDTPSKNVAEDNKRLAEDENDTARDAVLEGQAMAVFVDYNLKPEGKSLLTAPNIVNRFKEDMDSSADSPVMARAPRLLQESLLFPYREGLGFEQALLKDKGTKYAFPGTLDRPPSTSYEIMTPEAYEQKRKLPLLHMPDVHELLGSEYQPYDIGVMGELDVRILAGDLGGPAEAAALTPQWDGGLYYAVQSKKAKTAEEKASTGSLALLYLSAWRTEAAANEFAALYARGLARKYSGVTRDRDSESLPTEAVYRTSEGPVLIVRQGKKVFVSESFDLVLARKLQFLLFGAQQDDQTEMTARQEFPVHAFPVHAFPVHAFPVHDLTQPITDFLAGCGMMKAALLH